MTNRQSAEKVPKKPQPKGGSRKGRPNKTTAVLKDAILLAAEQVGHDGEGEGGLVGYLKRVAVEDVKAFSGLLGRVLPLQLTGANGRTLAEELQALSDE